MLSIQMLKKLLHTRGAKEGQRQPPDFLAFVGGGGAVLGFLRKVQ